MQRIAKMDPQPGPLGVFSTGYTRADRIDADGRKIHDPDWDLRPATAGVALFGAWSAEDGGPSGWFQSPSEDMRSTKEGVFIRCPVTATVEEWLTRAIDFAEIDGEWWWVRR